MSARNFATVRRAVVKVGSAVLAADGHLSATALARLAADVRELHDRGIEVVLVVSGAVAAGFRQLGWTRAPREVVPRQAAASVGQPRLMAAIDAAFAVHGRPVAQLLLSAEDIEHRRRFLSARHTLRLLLDQGVVPVINENDALSDDEIKVGDNDHLAALVTQLVSADLLVLLSQVEGILRDGGAGPRIAEVEQVADLDGHLSKARSSTGVGGMVAKVSAAALASTYGVATVIADGRKPGLLAAIVSGDDIGTLFLPRGRQMSARKRWIGVRSRSRGVVTVDPGAELAIKLRGASLLPSGVRAVSGDFERGSRVELRGETGELFAVGLASYDAGEIRRVAGRRTTDVEAILGYRYIEAIVEREDLVLLDAAKDPAREVMPYV